MSINLDQSSTRRGRRIERQRHEIMDAAARVFAEKGYSGTTTRDIAEAVDIGESTLYNYFDSKREILLAIAAHQAHILDAAFENAGLLQTRQQMVDLFDQIIQIVLSQSHYTRALIGEAWVNDEILNRFLMSRLNQVSSFLQNFIELKVKTGAFRPVNARLGARIVIAVFIGAILPSIRGVEPHPTPEQRRELAESIISFWMEGVEIPRKV